MLPTITCFQHMYKNTVDNVRESRDMLYDAKNVLTQIKSQITVSNHFIFSLYYVMRPLEL